jgi:capsular exopolysaccharide synthesis family protein
MNARFEDERLRADLHTGFDQELRDALIAQCRLSPEDVERICDSMRTGNMTFGEAAVHVGAVTQSEAAEAEAWARSTFASANIGVVEQALHKQGSTRQLSVRYAGFGRPSARLRLVNDSQLTYGDSVRALRSELLLLHDQDKTNGCFAILSPGPGEGRSHLAAELAICLAQLNRRTLLVDADLRNPTQHRLFDVDAKWGLSQALGFAQQPQLFGVEGLQYLSLIPCAPSAINPSELLCSGNFKQQLRRWRQNHDFVIIDTPPMARYPDALNIASACRNVLLVGRAQTTAYRDMKSALRRLSIPQFRLLGSVYNDF